MVFELLRRRGGEGNPLKRASFEPFEKDFEELQKTYRQLQAELDKIRRTTGKEVERSNVELMRTDPSTSEEEPEKRREELGGQIDQLLKGMYAYINWGLRQQAKTEKELDRILEDVGFHLPVIGEQRVLFDVVFPTTLLVALVGFAWAIIVPAITPASSTSVFAPTSDFASAKLVNALTSATAAGLMYGFAIFNALTRRSAKIEEKSWTQSSPRCFISIAVSAGLVSWLVIVSSTILWHVDETTSSMIGIWKLFRSAGSGVGADQWQFLPTKILTALPWVVAGGTASALLAHLFSGDVRRRSRHDRIREAVMLSGGLGLAAAFSTGLQMSLADFWQSNHNLTTPILVSHSLIEGVGDAVTGFIVGYFVPSAFRQAIVAPADLEGTRKLRELLQRAENVIGKPYADDWFFTPRNELGAISPAEAIEYKGLVNRVSKLLDEEAPRSQEREATIVPFNAASLR
jgi:hypothetical protein